MEIPRHPMYIYIHIIRGNYEMFVANSSHRDRNSPPSYPFAQREILSNQTEIGLYFPFSD